MRFRHLLLFTVFVVAVQANTAAAPSTPTATDDFGTCEVSYASDEAAAFEDVVPGVKLEAVQAPLEEKEHGALESEAYDDIYGILKERNSCSNFFGGPAQAVEAFNQLAKRLKRKSLGNRTIAVQMRGQYGLYKNNATGASYRLFDEATFNTDGPLNRANHLSSRGSLKNIGRYAATTRQARALVFLHELGHLVQGQDGAWVLPNDGESAVLSDRNTRIVTDKCSSQLAALN